VPFFIFGWWFSFRSGPATETFEHAVGHDLRFESGKKSMECFAKKNESMAIGDSTRMLLLLLKARITVAKESDKGYAGDLRNCRVGVILHCRLSVIGLH